jgi:hypothetical protein
LSSLPEHSQREPDLDDLAEAAEREEELRRSIAKDSMLEFVPWATSAYGRPAHLHRIIEAWERAVRGEPIRICFSAPPQHGKSDTLAHGVAWGLWQHPEWRFAYATYGDRLVLDKSKLARRLVTERIGLTLDGESLTQWDTDKGGGFIATSVRGSLTGKRVDRCRSSTASSAASASAGRWTMPRGCGSRG